MIKLFNKKINSITVAAALVATSSLVSRFLGIFRDRILASEFGAGDTLDIYYAAFRIPDLIFNLLVLGALSAGFIPIFTSLMKKNGENKEAWRLVSNVLNIMGVTLIFLSILGIIFAPCLMKMITPGFSEAKRNITVDLTRIMFLSPFFLGISSILGGVLQSYRRFFVYSLSPIFYNFGIIIGALYFTKLFGIHGLAFGVILGSILHMAIQIPTVISLGFRYYFKINLLDKNVIKIEKMMVPRTMSLAISQINLVVITIIASTLASGSLTIFNFANNLQFFPIGVFGISFAIAAFPRFSEVAFSIKKLVIDFSSTVRQILFFIVPSTILLIILRAQIIRVILGAGRFDWEDTVLTIDTLGFFAISLFAQALIPLLVRVFYARHNSKTPFFTGLATAGINVILSLWLSKTMGVAGLALAFSLASIFNFVVLWLILRFELGDMQELRILTSAIKFSIAGLACGLGAQGMKLLIWPFIDMNRFWGVLAQGLAAGLFGLVIYLALCSLLRSEELFDFWQAIKRRLPFGKVETGDRGEARGI